MARCSLRQGKNGPFLAYSNVHFGRNVIVGPFTTLGFPSEQSIRAGHNIVDFAKVALGDSVLVGSCVMIHEGTEIGARTVIEDHARIGYNCRIGDDSRIMYGAFICDRVRIAQRVRVAGFVCDGAVIREQASSMGNLVHEYSQPHQGWWDVDEVAPVLHEGVVVGYGATVIGEVVVGARSYIAAGATVTRDVPPEHVVIGVNGFVPFGQWSGNGLKEFIRSQTRKSSEQ